MSRHFIAFANLLIQYNQHNQRIIQISFFYYPGTMEVIMHADAMSLLRGRFIFRMHKNLKICILLYVK